MRTYEYNSLRLSGFSIDISRIYLDFYRKQRTEPGGIFYRKSLLSFRKGRMSKLYYL